MTSFGMFEEVKFERPMEGVLKLAVKNGLYEPGRWPEVQMAQERSGHEEVFFLGEPDLIWFSRGNALYNQLYLAVRGADGTYKIFNGPHSGGNGRTDVVAGPEKLGEIRPEWGAFSLVLRRCNNGLKCGYGLKSWLELAVIKLTAVEGRLELLKATPSSEEGVSEKIRRLFGCPCPRCPISG